ncbi:Beta-lysine acetyltransferase (EC [Olavius algarvensis associated proteobacterium Delta 3]|nr:Beta-lysine acetyltransferase (EC [Olavius algarvensis associated proteobacterium Delta 3]
MPADPIETIYGSTIQHGPHNNRIYLMRLNPDDVFGLMAILDDMVAEHGYGKVFAKIPAPEWRAFRSAGYIKEASVPGFFNGETDGLFVAKYFSERRKEAESDKKLSRLLDRVETENRHPPDRVDRDVASCRQSDAEEMSNIYRQVFRSYPFPIQQPTYLIHMMTEGVPYFCVRMKDRIAAIAAAEIDSEHQNAEMTDFATLPEWRGMGFAGMLLRHMERKTRERGVITTYTIARAESLGMNAVFKNNGYTYAGLLKNNSQIGGRIQSMTVWYKRL